MEATITYLNGKPVDPKTEKEMKEIAEGYLAWRNARKEITNPDLLLDPNKKGYIVKVK